MGEFGPLHTRVSLDVSLWPLELRYDGGDAHVECGECRTGKMLVAKTKAKPFAIADLKARVEEHIARCPGAWDRS
jgi:hypothetical protein